MIRDFVAYTMVANHVPVNAQIIGPTSMRVTMCSISCSTIRRIPARYPFDGHLTDAVKFALQIVSVLLRR